MTWFRVVLWSPSAEAFELATRQVVESCLSEMRQLVDHRLATMNRSQVHGYLRGHARAVVRRAMAQCDLANPRLAERAIDQLIRRLSREWMLQPVTAGIRRAA